MSASNYLENAVLNFVLGGVALTAPATVYLALHTANPTEDGSVGEVTGGSYARVAITNNLTNWPSTNTGSKASAWTGNFPTPSAGWGDVTYWSLWDAATNGNCLFISAAFTAQPILAGNVVSVANGALVVTMD